MPHIELVIQYPTSGVSVPEAPGSKLYQAPPALIFGVYGPAHTLMLGFCCREIDSNLFKVINVEGGEVG